MLVSVYFFFTPSYICHLETPKCQQALASGSKVFAIYFSELLTAFPAKKREQTMIQQSL